MVFRRHQHRRLTARLVSTASWLVLLAVLPIVSISAVLPTAQLVVDSGEGSGYAAISSFSSVLPSSTSAAWTPMVVPSGSRTACDEALDIKASPPFIVVAERGECSFDFKAGSAKAAGASAIVVVNTWEATYGGREYGEDRTDYECGNGEGWLPSVTSPAWSAANDVPACSADARCASGRCMLTNVTDSSLGTKVCCAWDLFLTMGSSSNTTLHMGMPAVFMTMAQGDALLSNSLLLEGDGAVQGKLYNRPEPYINLSCMLLWALGVATAVFAGWHSAREMRPHYKRAATAGGLGGGAGDAADESVELTLGHTVGFIAFASGMLLVLFFFNLSFAVTALYCVSAGSAVAAVIVAPLLRRARLCIMPYSEDRIIPLGPLGEASVLDIAALAIAWSMTLWWALVRDAVAYDWVLQDLFGCSLCVVFLASLRLTNLRVAAVLLSLAFVYDIFWVFLSPFLFSESVMVAVATGGDSTVDPLTCEKYPDTHGCVVHTLPMLLKLPRIGDYQGGSVMLGLGDIVLPGLLLSFAARFDAASGLPLCRGYFVYVAGGYAAGLMMANLAVIMTGLGQPALLYLVPCTLGLMSFIAWADGTLPELWRGPPALAGVAEAAAAACPAKRGEREEQEGRSALLYNL
ncbi:putative growth-on protein GRO10 [Tribonema minus]|uniref:Putative growth-on protein GRO10 n=1 Tax=Tribonema minus TaxID=303371 RepID=A0A836CBZ5_9STRA|nr:putative growth-on protein GRO10 [Tribonema minus]